MYSRSRIKLISWRSKEGSRDNGGKCWHLLQFSNFKSTRFVREESQVENLTPLKSYTSKDLRFRCGWRPSNNFSSSLLLLSTTFDENFETSLPHDNISFSRCCFFLKFASLESELATSSHSKCLISSFPLKLFSCFNSPSPPTCLKMEGGSLLTTNNGNV
ncbi:hypothetical protein ACB098_11G177400 [Castanea mollissima]